jgi:hypothetical protein
MSWSESGCIVADLRAPSPALRKHNYEAIVVGSGFGGAVAASTLPFSSAGVASSPGTSGCARGTGDLGAGQVAEPSSCGGDVLLFVLEMGE